ncbi:MAG: glycogen debranching enzyme family protein [Sedimentisphaerales bacterium]|nr:glycogen debranching enzyme family protein [Sedimentisphaerales bacterium]
MNMATAVGKKVSVNMGIQIDASNTPIERLLEKEWLLTNSRGGYSASSIVGCNTRRYHGLLIGSLEPPVKRVMALSHFIETVVIWPGKFNLATCEFPDTITPDGYHRLKRFTKDTGAHFYYELGDLRVTKSVYLFRDRDAIAVVYEFEEVAQPIEFEIRPFAAMRDYHSLQKAGDRILCKTDSDGLIIRNEPGTQLCGRLRLSYPEGIFESMPQWWNNFTYRSDRERGQDYSEDLFSPGIIRYHLNSDSRIVLWADLSGSESDGSSTTADKFLPPDIEYVTSQLREHLESVIAPANGDRQLGELFAAGDQFIVRRKTQDTRPKTEERMQNAEFRIQNIEQRTERTTILAGYPWFADWGRDAFLSLPGLLLATKRYEEAKSVLLMFAEAVKDGVLPNCFDDYGGGAHFNSVDAGLWFINSAFGWLAATGEEQVFRNRMLPVIISIIENYQKGTMFGIHADADGLLAAGDSSTQLTWMDAKFNDVVFTPRFGKPVEVNALWYNANMLLVQYLAEGTKSQGELLGILRSRVNTIQESFNKSFWNETWGWLNDCILPATGDKPDGTADATLRPNQIFAVSLPYSALTPARQKAVVDIVEKKLLTAYGFRTLSPDDRRYQGSYSGPQQTRDGAYHQGTIWPYLMGPFVEAYLKVNGFSGESKKRACGFIETLLKQMNERGCLGQICEIYDGDAPSRPKGCFAQAWSVAEMIRAYLLTQE